MTVTLIERSQDDDTVVLSDCPTCGEPVFADDEQFMRIHGLMFHAACARYQRRAER